MRLQTYSFHNINLVRDVFIETGTYEGETTACAMKAGYKKVHTIEVNRRLAAAAKAKFAGTIVTVHCGSSPDILPFVCDPTAATTFWLDAHYQGGPKDEMDIRYGECPVIQELDVILSVPWEKKPYILIDDAHIFAMKPNRDEFVAGRNLNPRE